MTKTSGDMLLTSSFKSCNLTADRCFTNYKHFFSVLLLALMDANYKFLYVDVDLLTGGVFNN